ncbi:MAG: HAMP domain-containing sensor histidine kinase [bacterium]
MFRAAVLRLTLWYLALVMLLSVSFSISLYRVSTGTLDADQHRQEALLQSSFYINLQPGFTQFTQTRLAQIEESREAIQSTLIYFNLIILLVGGALSYLLARRTLRPIEETLESQQRFTADASHELRTPLTVMKSEIEVALRDTGLTLAESKQLLKSNLEEIGRLEALSNGLLKLAQQDSQERLSAFKNCDLHAIIREAGERVAPAAKKRRVTISSDSADLSVWGDQWSLVELVSILLDNAIKYSPAGTTVEVSTSSLYQGSQTAIRIKDHGIGIPATDLPLIFDRFYRADQSRNQNSTAGYGLGLSIAAKIAKLHHGSIEVVSAPGKGSVFSVILPSHHSRLPGLRPHHHSPHQPSA